MKREGLYKTVAAVAVCAVLCVSGAGTVVGFVKNDFVKKFVAEKNAVRVDFTEEYPFEEPEETQPQPAQPLLVRLLQRADFGSKVESYCVDYNVLTPAYAHLYGTTSRLLGKQRIEDAEEDVYRLTNGVLSFAEDAYTPEDGYQSVVDFAAFLRQKQTPFLITLPVNKADETEKTFPRGVLSWFDRNNRQLQAVLTDNRIDFLDTKPLLLARNPDFYSWFYKTDHHWNVQAGLATAADICSWLTKTGVGADESRLDESRFEATAYPKLLFGSQGKKAKLGYANPEDFTVLLPKEQTSFTCKIVNEKTGESTVEGSFEEALLDKTCLRRDYYGTSAYEAFMHSDQAYMQVTNHLCDNDTRLLVIKKSKADVVTPFLACAVKELDIVDPRHFNGSIRTLINKTAPDAVVIVDSGPENEDDTSWTLK